MCLLKCEYMSGPDGLRGWRSNFATVTEFVKLINLQSETDSGREGWGDVGALGSIMFIEIVHCAYAHDMEIAYVLWMRLLPFRAEIVTGGSGLKEKKTKHAYYILAADCHFKSKPTSRLTD